MNAYPDSQAFIQAARNIEPDNDRLIEAGDYEETQSSLAEAARVLGVRFERTEEP